MIIMRRTALLQILFLLAGVLCGCASAVRGAGTVEEKIEPEGILIGKDGSFAIKAKLTYCRKSFSLAHKEILLETPRPHLVFLIPRSDLEEGLRYEKPDKDGIAHIQFLYVRPDGSGSEIIPHEYGSEENPYDHLPIVLGPAVAEEYSLSHLVPYHLNGKKIFLDLSGVKVHSDRDKTKWWVGPATVPATAADVIVGFTATCVSLPVGLTLIGVHFVVSGFNPEAW